MGDFAAYVSIPVPREGNDQDSTSCCFTVNVSIPVPREGNDVRADVSEGLFLVSIPVPREGNDRLYVADDRGVDQFQSPFPVRGTTRRSERFQDYITRFNPRSP